MKNRVKRFARVLVVSAVAILILMALFILGLRLLLPSLNQYRESLLTTVASIVGFPVRVQQIEAAWTNFGPRVVLNQVMLPLQQGNWQARRITMELDVWRSLLHQRWQFRDLTFYQVSASLDTQWFEQTSDELSLSRQAMQDLLLRQFAHFTLYDSQITFLTPSGESINVTIPQLTWLNQAHRHRAQGKIQLSQADQQYGTFQLRIDLRDTNHLLDRGMIYLQAEDVDMKPWLSRWWSDNTGLGQANFNVASWFTVSNGQISGIDVSLKQGKVNWHNKGTQHRLDVKDLLLQAKKSSDTWQLDVPSLNFMTDGHEWPSGQLRMLWLPHEDPNLEQLRIRASSLSLQRLYPLLPMFSSLSPAWLNELSRSRLSGEIEALALDIPLKQPENSRFQVSWREVAWQQLSDNVPGINHFSGQAGGGREQGQSTISIGKGQQIPYAAMFRAPLEIAAAEGQLSWRYSSQQGLEFWSDHLALKARSIWINGSFNFELPTQGEPYLGILAGIRLQDARDAWRYYPQTLMGTRLTDYLSSALEQGQVDNATLVYAGNPRLFPFADHQGLFQVWVPLRQAVFRYQPDWPALENLAIDLNFLNDGLWMQAPLIQLGQATGKNVQAVIPHYAQDQLLIDADITGQGADIRDYFKYSPLKESVGNTLDELVLTGEVNGRLHLDVPLDHRPVEVSGSVDLRGNQLFIKPINSAFDKLSGQFRFRDSVLSGDGLTANWFGQPIKLDFSTQTDTSKYQIRVGLQGDWQVAQLPWLPKPIVKQLQGKGKWQSKVDIALPHRGEISYLVDIKGDLSAVKSQLPSPLAKPSGGKLPFALQAEGNQRGFTLSGAVNQRTQFNSRWRLAKGESPRLELGIWDHESVRKPALPKVPALQLKLPSLDGTGWLALLQTDDARNRQNPVRWILPDTVTLDIPELNMAGQQWQKLTLNMTSSSTTQHWLIKGQEIDGQLRISGGQPWRLDLAYLYYNPPREDATKANVDLFTESKLLQQKMNDWPGVRLRCQNCWLIGQPLRQVEGDIRVKQGNFILENGLVDTGNTRLVLNGVWQRQGQTDQSSFSGQLSGDNIENSMIYFGQTTPLKNAPFKFDFTLEWQGIPWQPDIKSLNGDSKIWLGRGELADMGGGRAGQLLRLVSFDALLRKLRFDFSDTFGQAFYFDNVRGNAKFKQGILSTDNLFLNGLAADISMIGNVDLVRQKLDMQAVVAPALSTTVGVATAFAVNPIAGAVVFAASRVLGPLWEKISLIRYQITGDLAEPKVNEILRQPNTSEKKAPKRE